ncbi:MAG: type II toxin-antitoxin system VapC family toxin [Candidatus Lokiarchaeota archaeon]|nr:type II toxin-antitoxin system VapC family toxin [Candidatus Lokiarchaeota archaeon]
MAVLDTDVLVYYLRGKNDSYTKINNLKKEKESLNTTIFNVAELYKGCYSMKNVAKGLMKVKLLVDALDEIFLFENDSAEEFAKLSSDLKKRGQTIGIIDELIASICIIHQESLYTGNIKHFERIDDLIVNDWNKI